MIELLKSGKEQGGDEIHQKQKERESQQISGRTVSLLKKLKEVRQRLSPLWDVRDYVAVNPFFGFRQKTFLETARYINEVSNLNLYPKKSFFKKKYQNGEITREDLQLAIDQFLDVSATRDRKKIDVSDLLEFIHQNSSENNLQKIFAVSDRFDCENESKVTERIANEISLWASAYFDETQAVWSMPKEGLRFYSWWKSLAQFDSATFENGVSVKEWARTLPEDPEKALEELTQILMEKADLSAESLGDYFYRLLFSILGWASFFQRIEFEADRSGDFTELNAKGGLIDILVVRMTYDILFIDQISDRTLKSKVLKHQVDKELEFQNVWLEAAEIAYRNKIERLLISSRSNRNFKNHYDAQMAFCIDVRSEVMRRHIESLAPNIQTIGFAGFFGMPISFKAFGHHGADQNCPVLLNAPVQVCEEATSCEEDLSQKKSAFVERKSHLKSIQYSANSGFSFAETLGFGYAWKILKSGLGLSKPNINLRDMGLSVSDKRKLHLNLIEIPLKTKVRLAHSALKNMSLTSNFAKYVFFFGHGSESANNPYESALDCGACAGHNGHANAKLLAAILNESQVRQELRAMGIEIPNETVFLAGWHNTTKDILEFDRIESLSSEELLDLEKYSKIFEKAGENSRTERAQILPGAAKDNGRELEEEFRLRANDWSELRPEWGLARNACFVVGRRELTRNLDLEGRAFLHDYDFAKDSDLSVLELIMTAPMIVTNWINMQYYASTINPEKFGTGNKTLNNVMGGIGCIQSNESDLLGGLSEQSVWYQGEYFHEPLRLQVFIEADLFSIQQIVERHEMVRDLISNNWLKVISIHPETGEMNPFQRKL